MKYNINLLSKKDLTFFDRAVHFSLNYLRYILVITQLVVIMVLFYRFKIDNDILDLKDQINQKKEIIRVTQPLLDQVETLDNQVAGISTSVATQNTLEQSLTYLSSVYPDKIVLTDLSIDQGAYRIEGSATDADIVQLFYRKLAQDAKFTSVVLSNLNKDPTGAISFSLSLRGFRSSPL